MGALGPVALAVAAIGLAAFVLAATACGSGDRSRPATGPLPRSWHHDTETPAVPAGVVARVLAVTDGDTIRVGVDGRDEIVRLLGIDTPEKAGGPRPAECFGAEASTFLEQVLPVGTTVVLSRDVESRDQYGRLLAWIHRLDGVFVNLAMVESGHASALFFAPNDSLEPLFEQAAWRARRLRRGFWTACGGPDLVLSP